jgi:hypothetical protein
METLTPRACRGAGRLGGRGVAALGQSAIRTSLRNPEGEDEAYGHPIFMIVGNELRISAFPVLHSSKRFMLMTSAIGR